MNLIVLQDLSFKWKIKLKTSSFGVFLYIMKYWTKKEVISHFVDFIGLLRLLQALFLIAAVHLEWESARDKMAHMSCFQRCNTFSSTTCKTNTSFHVFTRRIKKLHEPCSCPQNPIAFSPEVSTQPGFPRINGNMQLFCQTKKKLFLGNIRKKKKVSHILLQKLNCSSCMCLKTETQEPRL